MSFYYCYGPRDELRCTVAEVNNTFGERHLYVLDQHLNGQVPTAPGAQGVSRVAVQ